MVYTVMVFAPRLPGITHEQFKTRYEKHMLLVEEICGDAMPLQHTRWYPQHGADDKPILVAGSAEHLFYDAIVTMVFEDEAAWQKFSGALTTEEANARIEADEAGFWDRSKMAIMLNGEIKEWKR